METLLNRDQLLTPEKLEVVKVNLGKDEFVYVRQMTGRERDHFEQSLIKENKNVEGGYEKSLEDFRAKLSVCTVCDAEGKLIFQQNDYSVLSQSMSAARLEKIVNVAQKLNKISEEDKEGLVKNFEAGLAGSSSSDSAGK
jgi:hypothetical protein